MESDKIRLMLHRDKLIQDYYNTLKTSNISYEEYPKDKGLSSFRNVPIFTDHPSGITVYINEYTITDPKQFLLTKIKYGI